MIKILDRLVSQIEAQGHTADEAYPIAVSALKKSGNLDKKGKVTAKGIRRGNMTPAERAKDRASKKTGHKKSDYVYNSQKNSVKLKKSKSKTDLFYV